MDKGIPETLLARIANTPYADSTAWLDFVTEVLRLDGCYVPAAQRIVSQGDWRRHTGKGQNAIGYIKIATYREALKMGLALDRFDPTEPRVATKDQPLTPKDRVNGRADELRFDFVPRKKGHVPLNIPEGANFQDEIDRLHAVATYDFPTKAANGAWHQGGFSADDDGEPNSIPMWLQCEDDPETVNWDIVARYAVQKRRMVPSLAKTLRLRFDDRMGRPAAMAAAKNAKAAREIENCWKWIDRNWRSRIAPLFQLQAPPVEAQKISPRPHSAGRFIPPGEALTRAIRRPQAQAAHEVMKIGPSLQNHDRLGTALQKIGVPQDVHVGWNNGQLMVGRWNEYGISINGDTLTEALEILEDLVTTGTIDMRKAHLGIAISDV
jgi:hypothetical protein